MKLIKIVNAVDNLDKLSMLSLPAKESFKVVNLLMEIDPYIKNYHTQKNNLLAKYGDSEDEKTYTIREDEKDNFIKEVEDLGNIEITLNFEKIKISDKLTIRAADLVNILEFVEVGD